MTMWIRFRHILFYSSILYRLRVWLKMAESHLEAYQNETSEGIRMPRYGCSSILNDDSFMIPRVHNIKEEGECRTSIGFIKHTV